MVGVGGGGVGGRMYVPNLNFKYVKYIQLVF